MYTDYLTTAEKDARKSDPYCVPEFLEKCIKDLCKFLYSKNVQFKLSGYNDQYFIYNYNDDEGYTTAIMYIDIEKDIDIIKEFLRSIDYCTSYFEFVPFNSGSYSLYGSYGKAIGATSRRDCAQAFFSINIYDFSWLENLPYTTSYTDSVIIDRHLMDLSHLYNKTLKRKYMMEFLEMLPNYLTHNLLLRWEILNFLNNNYDLVYNLSNYCINREIIQDTLDSICLNDGYASNFPLIDVLKKISIYRLYGYSSAFYCWRVPYIPMSNEIVLTTIIGGAQEIKAILKDLYVSIEELESDNTYEEKWLIHYCHMSATLIVKETMKMPPKSEEISEYGIFGYSKTGTMLQLITDWEMNHYDSDLAALLSMLVISSEAEMYDFPKKIVNFLIDNKEMILNKFVREDDLVTEIFTDTELSSALYNLYNQYE